MIYVSRPSVAAEYITQLPMSQIAYMDIYNITHTHAAKLTAARVHDGWGDGERRWTT